MSNRMKNLSLLLALALCTHTLAFTMLDRGGKTHIGLTHFDKQRLQQSAVWHTHTTTDLGNPLGVSMQVTSFFNQAVRTNLIAQHFTHKESERILIETDRFNQKSDSALPYHAIVHNPSTEAVEPAPAYIALTPSWSNIGAQISIFYDASLALPGLAFSAHVPIYYSTARLTDAGASSIIKDYFAGNYAQTSPLQAALEYGLHGTHQHTVAGPLTLTAHYNVIEEDTHYLMLSGGVGITLKRKPIHTFLFNYHSSGYDHSNIIAGIEAGGTITQTTDLTVEIITQLHYTYYFGGTENRILGISDDDGSIPVHTAYRLGAEKNVAGVFPLANILHRTVKRTGLHELDIALSSEFNWHNWILQIGYGLRGRQEEELTVDEWQPGTYAMPSPLYATTMPFTNTLSTADIDIEQPVVLNHRYITTDMLNMGAATHPAQISLTASAGTGYTFDCYGYPLGIGFGITYEHGLNNATPSIFGAWFKAVLSI